jgi:DnaJ-class molecular chaperone
MDLNKNYYKILEIAPDTDRKGIKKSYFKLSFIHHPDKGGDVDMFKVITEAYTILFDEKDRLTYDSKSRFGNIYNEASELYDMDHSVAWNEDKYIKFKDKELLNIIIIVNTPFTGSVNYERWVGCKKCNGSGKDLDSKIILRDHLGNITKIFEGDDGCDFCEGSGKNWNGDACSFCFGEGKVGVTNCGTCHGEKRIKGKQKLSGILIPDNFDEPIRVPNMGNVSKDLPGKCGHLFIRVNKT